MSLTTISYATTWHMVMDIITRVVELRGDRPLPLILSSLPELPEEGFEGPPVSIIQGPPGRNVAVAIGLRAALPDIPLLLIMNADAITLGTNHFIHAARRNFGMTLLILRSEVTQATEAQSLDRMRWGALGFQQSLETMATPLEWGMALQAALVGRGSLLDPDHLAELVHQAMDTPGFSLIGVTAGANLELGVLDRNEWPEYVSAYRQWSASFRNMVDDKASKESFPPRSTKNVPRYEVRIAGLGGHGVKLAGVALSEAAGIYEGLWATQRGEYGSATRGGPSMVDVIFGSDHITYPGADDPNLLVALSQKAVDSFAHRVKPNGHLVVDPGEVETMPERALLVPIVKLARETVGKPIAAGVVALGCVAALSGSVSLDSLRKSVASKVPLKVRDKNIAALEAGYEATLGALK
jgi:2-oxoglutarate ferredoxin oxidoreductase subunit gamma